MKPACMYWSRRDAGGTANALALNLLFCGAVMLCLVQPAASASPRDDRLFQYSIINALLIGLYDGELTIGELARHGDTGLGTVNGIDGELVALEGRFYHVRADGRAYPLPPEARTPFAVVNFHQPDAEHRLPSGLDYQALCSHLEGLIHNGNGFQGFRIDGHFESIEVRSEPKQTRPFRPLAQVISEQQVVFTYENIDGSLIGFRTPPFAAGLNVPGYHFHFISAQRDRGGHVLALRTRDGRIGIDEVAGIRLQLPTGREFAEAELSSGSSSDLKRVETGK